MKQKYKVEQLPVLWNIENKSRQNVCLPCEQRSPIWEISAHRVMFAWLHASLQSMSTWSVTQLEVESRRSTITIENHLHFFEYFDDKIIYMKFSFRFWKGSIYSLIFWVFLHKYRKIWVRKDSACKYSPPFWVLSQVRFQVSSVIKCYRHHENRCCSKTAEENAIKLHASPNSRTVFTCTSSEYHELLELDLRMLLYFFSRKFNIWSFFSWHRVIMRFFRWLCDRMRQEVNCAKLHQRTISEALIGANTFSLTH